MFKFEDFLENSSKGGMRLMDSSLEKASAGSDLHKKK